MKTEHKLNVVNYINKLANQAPIYQPTQDWDSTSTRPSDSFPTQPGGSNQIQYEPTPQGVPASGGGWDRDAWYSWIPGIGDAGNAISNFSEGNYAAGLGDVALGATSLFTLGLGGLLAKGGIKGISKLAPKLLKKTPKVTTGTKTVAKNPMGTITAKPRALNPKPRMGTGSKLLTAGTVGYLGYDALRNQNPSGGMLEYGATQTGNMYPGQPNAFGSAANNSPYSSRARRFINSGR